MLNQTQNNNINFRWRHTTHRVITKAAVNRANELGDMGVSLSSKKIAEASILPDFKHKKFPHIADINKLERNDGFSMFCKFDNLAIKAYKRGNMREFSENLGKALHYVQDILNPYHVARIDSKQSPQVSHAHNEFEKYASKIEERTVSESKHRVRKINTEQDFRETLKGHMQNAKTAKNKRFNNTRTQKETARGGLKNAYRASLEYLESVKRRLAEPCIAEHN